MFAVIKTGGKQYAVTPDTKLKIEKIKADEKGKVVFNNVLLIADGDDIKIGSPVIEGAQVSGRIIKEDRDRKVIVFKYQPKKRYKVKKGHRQHYSEVLIEEIKS